MANREDDEDEEEEEEAGEVALESVLEEVCDTVVGAWRAAIAAMAASAARWVFSKKVCNLELCSRAQIFTSD